MAYVVAGVGRNFVGKGSGLRGGLRHCCCERWRLRLNGNRIVRGSLRMNVPSGSGERQSSSSSVIIDHERESKESGKRLRVLSGVQPTGCLHLGNYLGAMSQWKYQQDLHDSYFFVVDLHAITVPQDPVALKEATLGAVAMYLACGVDVDKAKVFVQSHVSAHAELTWLLNCVTPMGWLERMIQYKEKKLKQGNDVSLGLFDYPVLMAADVILYQADLVPVGEDQKQHIELARDIARRFNDRYVSKKLKKKGKWILKEPKPLVRSGGARIMALDDGTSKMSKSAENEGSRINLLDPPDVIARKIKRCKTDSLSGLEYGNLERPECNNLLTIYQLVTGSTKEQVEQECSAMRFGTFKPILADAIVAHLEPIQTQYKRYIHDPEYLGKVLKHGRDAASEEAQKTVDTVKTSMGFVLPRELGF